MEFLLDGIDRFPLEEEFADIHEHSDPLSLALLENSGSAVADLNAGSWCRQHLGGEGNDSTRVGVEEKVTDELTMILKQHYARAIM
ncbi:hypothetical protein VPH35_089027 [Triticum aestivum]